MGTFPQLISDGCFQGAAEGELAVLSCRKEMLLRITLLLPMWLPPQTFLWIESNMWPYLKPTGFSTYSVFMHINSEKRSGRLSQVGVIVIHKMWCWLSLLPFSHWACHSLLQKANMPLTLIFKKNDQKGAFYSRGTKDSCHTAKKWCTLNVGPE